MAKDDEAGGPGQLGKIVDPVVLSESGDFHAGNGVRQLQGAFHRGADGQYRELPAEFFDALRIFTRCARVASEMLEHGDLLVKRGEKELGAWWQACGRVANTIARLPGYASGTEYARELALAAQNIAAKMDSAVADERFAPEYFRSVYAPATLNDRDEEFFKIVARWCIGFRTMLERGTFSENAVVESAQYLSEEVARVYRGFCPSKNEALIPRVAESLKGLDASDDAEKVARAVMRAACVPRSRIKNFRNAENVRTTRRHRPK